MNQVSDTSARNVAVTSALAHTIPALSMRSRLLLPWLACAALTACGGGGSDTEEVDATMDLTSANQSPPLAAIPPARRGGPIQALPARATRQ
jgi:hypothetical protein